MKKMLINATQLEELRVAIIDGQKLVDLDIESGIKGQKKSNIYNAKVTRIEPSLEAAFIDYGAGKHGFLPLKEVAPEYYNSQPKSGYLGIRNALTEGQSVIVQICKEERGNKGAALTTYISLAGRYLVLMPNKPKAGGISRRIEGDHREELQTILKKLDTPSDMGLIVRTAALSRKQKDLQWDIDYLLQLWASIKTSSKKIKSPSLLHQESNITIRAVRDHLRQDIHEVVIDKKRVYQEAMRFIKKVMPQYSDRLKYYESDIPLFSKFHIESQIETAFKREVRLPSGGSIVIDPTEALVSIDINSAKSTKGSSIEETALTTNLEAADEIARQLRLRDIGGLVVIDFIDMRSIQNQKEVENQLKNSLSYDKAKIQLSHISRFGLLEMSRQRLGLSLGETSGVMCPRCSGQGTIRDIESLSLSIFRVIEEYSLQENIDAVKAQVPIEIATFLLNEKRDMVSKIEANNNIKIFIVPDSNMETPHYDVQILNKHSDFNSKDVYNSTPEAKSSSASLGATIKKPTSKKTPAENLAQDNSSGIINNIGKFVKSIFSSSPDKPLPKNEETIFKPNINKNNDTLNSSVKMQDSRDFSRKNNYGKPAFNKNLPEAPYKTTDNKFTSAPAKDKSSYGNHKRDKYNKSKDTQQNNTSYQNNTKSEAKPTNANMKHSNKHQDAHKNSEALTSSSIPATANGRDIASNSTPNLTTKKHNIGTTTHDKPKASKKDLLDIQVKFETKSRSKKRSNSRVKNDPRLEKNQTLASPNIAPEINNKDNNLLNKQKNNLDRTIRIIESSDFLGNDEAPTSSEESIIILDTESKRGFVNNDTYNNNHKSKKSFDSDSLENALMSEKESFFKHKEQESNLHIFTDEQQNTDFILVDDIFNKPSKHRRQENNTRKYKQEQDKQHITKDITSPTGMPFLDSSSYKTQQQDNNDAISFLDPAPDTHFTDEAKGYQKHSGFNKRSNYLIGAKRKKKPVGSKYNNMQKRKPWRSYSKPPATGGVRKDTPNSDINPRNNDF